MIFPEQKQTSSSRPSAAAADQQKQDGSLIRPADGQLQVYSRWLANWHINNYIIINLNDFDMESLILNTKHWSFNT